jgi:hypothetical protein
VIDLPSKSYNLMPFPCLRQTLFDKLLLINKPKINKIKNLEYSSKQAVG